MLEKINNSFTYSEFYKQRNYGTKFSLCENKKTNFNFHYQRFSFKEESTIGLCR